MKWMIPAILVLFCSCVIDNLQSETDDEKEVREAFDSWVKAWQEGRMKDVVNQMTLRYQTQTLFGILQTRDDKVLTARRLELGESARKDFDIWVGQNLTRTLETLTPIPASVLHNGWLRDTIIQYMSEPGVQATMATEFSMMRVTSVYVDNSGATVLVRKRAGRAYFTCIPEMGFWKVDGYRRGKS